MKKRKKIAFDLDGCLVNDMTMFEMMAYKMYGLKFKKPINSYDIKTVPVQWSNEEMWDCFIESYQYYNDFIIYSGVRELMEKLYCLTREPIYIVTSRPQSAATYHYSLVERFLYKIPYVMAFSGRDDKWMYLDGVDYFVEDRKETAIDLAGRGIEIFMPVKDYNFMELPRNNIHPIQSVSDLIPELGIIL